MGGERELLSKREGKGGGGSLSEQVVNGGGGGGGRGKETQLRPLMEADFFLLLLFSLPAALALTEMKKAAKMPSNPTECSFPFRSAEKKSFLSPSPPPPSSLCGKKGKWANWTHFPTTKRGERRKEEEEEEEEKRDVLFNGKSVGSWKPPLKMERRGGRTERGSKFVLTFFFPSSPSHGCYVPSFPRMKRVRQYLPFRKKTGGVNRDPPSYFPSFS